MKFLTKKTILITFLIIFTSACNLFAQSEQEKISNLISKKSEFVRKNKVSPIYRIQLYNGDESEAYKLRSTFQNSFPEYKAQIFYKAPEWKVQVGEFKSRLEADKAMLVISEKYKGIVLKDMI